jgi:hypothetical protein
MVPQFGAARRPSELISGQGIPPQKGEMERNVIKYLGQKQSARRSRNSIRLPPLVPILIRGFNFPAHRNLRVSEGVENLLR